MCPVRHTPRLESERCEELLRRLEDAVQEGDHSCVQNILPQWIMNASAAGHKEPDVQLSLDMLMQSAARSNHGDTVSFLLASGAQIETLTTLPAVEGGATDSLQVFLSNGWDINADDPAFSTPLINAIHTNDKHLVQWLLDRGADPNLAGQKGNLSLTVKKSVVGTLFVSRPLDAAAAMCNQDIFELLLDYGAKIEECNALHSVSGYLMLEEEIRLPMIDFLLRKGMNINAIALDNDEEFLEKYRATRSRGTPLHFAARWKNLVVARHLIRNGALRDAKDSGDRIEGKTGFTPLRWLESSAGYRGHSVELELRDLLTGGDDAIKDSDLLKGS